MHVPHRKATAKEHLVVQALPNVPNMHGLYPAAGDKTKLVCTVGQTKAIIAKVDFKKDIVNGGVMFGNARTKWSGKRHVEVTLVRSYHQDQVTFPDGISLPIAFIAIGTRFSIGYPAPKKRAPRVRKITGEKGIAAVEQALDEVKKVGRKAAVVANNKKLATS
jgi:hypothetical protein